MILNNIYNFFLDILFPKKCLGCGQEGILICPECFAQIPVFKSANCFVCHARSFDGRICQKCRKKNCSVLAGLLVCSDWNNLLLRQIIYDFKYRFIRELAVPLSWLMIEFLKYFQFENLPIFNFKNDELIFVPVPLHPRRLSWRGFNQSLLLANRVANYFNCRVDDKIIKRARPTSPQMGIKEEKNRRRNIAGAFSLNKNIIKENKFYRDKIFVLIDDVSTTGATLEECAQALKQLKPKEIWGLVIARG